MGNPWKEPPPTWWPSSIPFKSTRKSPVHDLDKIIGSFLEYQAYNVMVRERIFPFFD